MKIDASDVILWSVFDDEPLNDAMNKASFGGDRSAAGRYAAEQRWKGHQRTEPKTAQVFNGSINDLVAETATRLTGQSSHYGAAEVLLNQVAATVEEKHSPFEILAARIATLVLDGHARFYEPTLADKSRMSAFQRITTIPEAVNAKTPQELLSAIENTPEFQAGDIDMVLLRGLMVDQVDHPNGEPRPSWSRHAVQTTSIMATIWTSGKPNAKGAWGEVIAREFGVTEERQGKPESASSETTREITDKLPGSMAVLRTLSRALYDQAQMILRQSLPAGTTHVTLYRGTALTDDEMRQARTGVVPIAQLTSFSDDTEESKKFMGRAKADATNSVVLTATVPVAKVFALSRQRFGQQSEREILVLGPSVEATVEITRPQPPSPDVQKAQVRRDAMIEAAFIKASFGGDRSAAGRYAAEQRWKGHNKVQSEKGAMTGDARQALNDTVDKTRKQIAQILSPEFAQKVVGVLERNGVKIEVTGQLVASLSETGRQLQTLVDEVETTAKAALDAIDGAQATGDFRQRFAAVRTVDELMAKVRATEMKLYKQIYKVDDKAFLAPDNPLASDPKPKRKGGFIQQPKPQTVAGHVATLHWQVSLLLATNLKVFQGAVDKANRDIGMVKASFGGDRSAAGRYAAEQRWKGHVKQSVGRNDKNSSDKLSLDELGTILESAKNVVEAHQMIAERLGKTMKPKVEDLSDDEINAWRSISDNGAKRLVQGEILNAEWATYGQGLYVMMAGQADGGMTKEDAKYRTLYYGKNTVGLRLSESAKIVDGAKRSSSLKAADARKEIEKTGSVRLVSFYSHADFHNLYWASQGFDGWVPYGRKMGGEVVFFNAEHLSVNRADLPPQVADQKVKKSFIRRDAMIEAALAKASFGGDRSAAGRYAAEQRWKGHVKGDNRRDFKEVLTNFTTVEQKFKERVRGQAEGMSDEELRRELGSLDWVSETDVGEAVFGKWRREALGDALREREAKLDSGTDKGYAETVETKGKTPTASGIGRLLTNARIPKSKWLASSMVRGYGKSTSGYEIKTDRNGNVYVSYFLNPIATISLNTEQIREKQSQQNDLMRSRLSQIQQTLQAKGYAAEIEYDERWQNLTGRVVVKNPQNDD